MEEGRGYYRKLCSSETLRSGKRGFFHDFSEYAIQSVGEAWISRIFGRLENDEDRIRALFNDAKIKGVVLETLARVQTLFRDKDPEISRRRRLEGFAAAAAGKREQALLLMSQAVLRAPPTGKVKSVDQGFSLPLALLGRAEIFLSTKEYELALEDLNMIAEDELPEKLNAEHERMKEECRDFLGKTELSVCPFGGSRKEILSDRGGIDVARRKPTLPRLSEGENPCLAGASRLLEIRETTSAGKHVVASKEINPADVLIVEPPLAACLLPEYFGTHCQHCFSRLRAPIGCPDCSSVAFCGRKCRDEAMTSYHKYECKILALLIGSGMSVLSTLALRMVTQIGSKKCAKIREKLRLQSDGERPSEETEASSVETKLSKSAKRRMRKKKLKDSRSEKNESACKEKNEAANRVLENTEEEIDVRAYDLVTHPKERSAKDFFERTLMAAFLLRCLQRVDFFESTARDDEVPSEEEIAVGDLLLKNLQLLQFNAHEFFETRLGREHRFRGSVPVYLGVAIYPTAARFNHDCYPAVTRYFVGRNIVMRASRALSPGDVVAENYGPIFTKRSLEERQRSLAGRYWFRCTCDACKEDWPRFENLSNDAARFKCPTKGCTKLHPRTSNPSKTRKCLSCRTEISLTAAEEALQKCEELYAEGFARMEEERPEDAIEVLTKALKMFHQVAVAPHKDTHLAEIALNACLADSGNTWKPILD